MNEKKAGLARLEPKAQVETWFFGRASVGAKKVRTIFCPSLDLAMTFGSRDGSTQLVYIPSHKETIWLNLFTRKMGNSTDESFV